jgi:hypothetical protein
MVCILGFNVGNQSVDACFATAMFFDKETKATIAHYLREHYE